MKTRNKVRVDRVVGAPLALALNWMARFLGKVLRRDHHISREGVRTVLIAKYVGMGSILQTTPLIRSLKQAFPDARILFLTGRGCRVLAARLENIDEIIVIDDRSIVTVLVSSAQALLKLFRSRVDLYFDLELYSAYGSVMALLSLSRNRIGFYREAADRKIGIYTHLIYFNTRCPIRYIYLQLAHAVGATPAAPDKLGQLRVTEADRQEITPYGLVPRQYLVINPNASDLMIERRWPTRSFSALIEQLLKSTALPVVLIGAPDEREYVAGIAPEIPGRVINLAGKLTLGGLLALLDQAAGVITNDTGPMHMAWALGTSTVCLFGPVDPNHYAWTGAGVEILYERVYCSPCLHEAAEPPCLGNNICMQRISVNQVLRAVQRILTCRTPGYFSAFADEFFVDQFGLPLGRVIRGSLEGAARNSGS